MRSLDVSGGEHVVQVAHDVVGVATLYRRRVARALASSVVDADSFHARELLEKRRPAKLIVTRVGVTWFEHDRRRSLTPARDHELVAGAHREATFDGWIVKRRPDRRLGERPRTQPAVARQVECADACH